MSQSDILSPHSRHYESIVASALLDYMDSKLNAAADRLQAVVDRAELNGNETSVPAMLGAFLFISRAVATMTPEDARLFLADRIIDGDPDDD